MHNTESLLKAHFAGVAHIWPMREEKRKIVLCKNISFTFLFCFLYSSRACDRYAFLHCSQCVFVWKRHSYSFLAENMSYVAVSVKSNPQFLNRTGQANFLSIQSPNSTCILTIFLPVILLKHWKTSTNLYVLQKYIECLLPDNNYSNFQYNQNCHIL